MRSSSSSSEGLPRVVTLNWEGSVESNEVKSTHLDLEQNVSPEFCCTDAPFLHQDSDQGQQSSSRRLNKSHHSKGKTRHGNGEAALSSGTGNCGKNAHSGSLPSYNGPKVCLIFHTFFYGVVEMVQISVPVFPAGFGRILGANQLLQIPPSACKRRR